jgi:hypothetical protein
MLFMLSMEVLPTMETQPESSSKRILKIQPKFWTLTSKIVNLFAKLLDMFNNPETKPSCVEYEKNARELFGLLTSPTLGKFLLSQSVHRFLCHGHQFLYLSEMPIGALSESALEARNKY